MAFLLGLPALPTGCAGPGLGHRLPELSFQGSARNPRPGRLCGPSGGSWPGRAGRKCAHPADLTSLPAILVSSLSSGRRVSPLSLPFGRSHVFQSPPPPLPVPSPLLQLSALPPARFHPRPARPGPTHRRRGAGRARPARRAGAACCRLAERSAVSARRRAPRARAGPPAGNARRPSQNSWAAPGSPARAIRPLRRPRGRRGLRASLGASPAGRAGRRKRWAPGRGSPRPGVQEPISQPSTLQLRPRTCAPSASFSPSTDA